MKEANLARAAKVGHALQKLRTKLEVMERPLQRSFGASLECRNATHESYTGVSVYEDDLPDYIKEVTLCLVKSEFRRQIAELEAELETL